MINTNEFKAAMLRAGLSMDALAKMIGISTASLSYKVNNRREFTTTEIKSASAALNLSVDERDLIFFADHVEK